MADPYTEKNTVSPIGVLPMSIQEAERAIEVAKNIIEVIGTRTCGCNSTPMLTEANRWMEVFCRRK
jgi:hypothetical protein